MKTTLAPVLRDQGLDVRAQHLLDGGQGDDVRVRQEIKLVREVQQVGDDGVCGGGRRGERATELMMRMRIKRIVVVLRWQR